MENSSKIDRGVLVSIVIMGIHSVGYIIYNLMTDYIEVFNREMLIITIYPLIGLLAFLFNEKKESTKWVNVFLLFFI